MPWKRKSLVIDAEGLRSPSMTRLLSLHEKRPEILLTPHPGEAAELIGTTTKSIQQDRFEAVRHLSDTMQATVVLKGAGTLIASHNELTSLCPYGNPGMATAGMGDALAGMLAALSAQLVSPFEAAARAVVAHAIAGDAAASEWGQASMLSGDIFGYLS